MKITRHQTKIGYAVLNDKKGFAGLGPNESGSIHAVCLAIDDSIERALQVLGGRYMTNTTKLQSVTITPLELRDGAVFVAVTVIATLEPNMMKDMRFLKGEEE